jgi:hypothetical protein
LRILHVRLGQTHLFQATAVMEHAAPVASEHMASAKQLLRGTRLLKDALMEYVLGYDIGGDGYLHDSNITRLEHLSDLFTTHEAIKPSHDEYIERRYPGAQKRYIELMASKEYAALVRLEQHVSAMLPPKPALPFLTRAELATLASSVVKDAADTTCITALYAIVDAAPTTEGFMPKWHVARMT